MGRRAAGIEKQGDAGDFLLGLLMLCASITVVVVTVW